MCILIKNLLMVLFKEMVKLKEIGANLSKDELIKRLQVLVHPFPPLFNIAYICSLSLTRTVLSSNIPGDIVGTITTS